MSTITNSLRPYFATRCPPGGRFWNPSRAPSATQEARFLFGATLVGLIGGAVIVMHALSVVTAFH